MTPALRRLFEATLDYLTQDSRIAGAWTYGSARGDEEDEYSDVDPVFLIRDADFDAVHDELRPMFELLCEKIALWWPEGINAMVDGVKNYACLFEADGALLQYDITIMKESFLTNPIARGFLAGVTPEQIIFDRTGAVRAAIESFKPDVIGAERLLWSIERYWVYVYIHTKYLLRGDMPKLLYAQRLLFDIHLEILQALRPDAAWSWWPLGMKRACSAESRRGLLDYFQPADQPIIERAFAGQMDAFSRDARAACGSLGVEYPEALENRIREHLAKAVKL